MRSVVQFYIKPLFFNGLYRFNHKIKVVHIVQGDEKNARKGYSKKHNKIYK